MPTPHHIRAHVIGPGYWAMFTIRCLHSATEKDRKETINMIVNDIQSFPCIDPCRKHALAYLRDHPFEDDMVKWVMDFHNFVNRRLEKEEFDRKKLEEEWKPKKCDERCKKISAGYWAAFHIRALNAKTSRDKHYAARHICLDLMRYPCLEHQSNMKKFLKENPVKKSIIGDECSLFEWTVDFHNYINNLKGKRIVSYAEAGLLWDPKGFCDRC